MYTVLPFHDNLIKLLLFSGFLTAESPSDQEVVVDLSFVGLSLCPLRDVHPSEAQDL